MGQGPQPAITLCSSGNCYHGSMVQRVLASAIRSHSHHLAYIPAKACIMTGKPRRPRLQQWATSHPRARLSCRHSIGACSPAALHVLPHHAAVPHVEGLPKQSIDCMCMPVRLCTVQQWRRGAKAWLTLFRVHNDGAITGPLELGLSHSLVHVGAHQPEGAVMDVGCLHGCPEGGGLRLPPGGGPDGVLHCPLLPGLRGTGRHLHASAGGNRLAAAGVGSSLRAAAAVRPAPTRHQPVS